MFSTDYPHPEGGRDPLAKFEEALEDVAPTRPGPLLPGNMAELLGEHAEVAATGA